jgi:hypothetical protein
MRSLSHVLNIHTLGSDNIEHFHSLVHYRIKFWCNTSSVRKVFRTQKKKKRYHELCWELVQEVPAGNVLKFRTFYPYQAGILIP